jgi:hypothetical protein
MEQATSTEVSPDPRQDKVDRLIERAANMMKSQFENERRAKSDHDWFKPMSQTIGLLEESNIEKAQILMKKYQERLESNKASYPKLRWPDLRLVVSEHQQEWGNFD